MKKTYQKNAQDMAAAITAAGIAGVSKVEVVNDELALEIDADNFLEAAIELRDTRLLRLSS